MHTGQAPKPIGTTQQNMGGIAFSPDGRLLAVSSDPRIDLYDCETGQLLRTSSTVGGSTCIAFSPDGLRIASVGNDGIVSLVDPLTGKVVFQLRGLAPGRRRIMPPTPACFLRLTVERSPPPTGMAASTSGTEDDNDVVNTRLDKALHCSSLHDSDSGVNSLPSRATKRESADCAFRFKSDPFFPKMKSITHIIFLHDFNLEPDRAGCWRRRDSAARGPGSAAAES